jgi:hypothetical protein
MNQLHNKKHLRCVTTQISITHNTQKKTPAMKTSSQPPSVTPIRLPNELRDWLKHQAIDNRRTLGNEIVYRLEQSRERQLAAQLPRE